ncbi:RIP metalloprotease RseP [Castellaniella sp. GW247-6E4]|uniref:RIP metalloprotease RseP n=1 Tax=Castellaniella sp. GW247-6E4 TaxID=3140380 RepID=UPI003315F6AD
MALTLLAFAFALGLLVTFHEFGHYWVARRCGVKVLRFSVGFGRILWQRTDRRGTQWALSAIPLGGYVKMLDDPPPGADESASHEAFNRKSLAQRSAVVLAGPLANLLLAVLLYTGLGVMGTLEPAAILSAPAAGTPAAQAGVADGDELLEVDGTPVHSWNDARWRLLGPIVRGGEITLSVRPADGGPPRGLRLHTQAGDVAPDGPDPLAAAGLALADARPRLGELTPGGAAEQAGLRAGDLVEAIGGVEHPSVATMIEVISAHPGEALSLRVRRDDAELTLEVTPRPAQDGQGAAIGRIGVLVQGERPMVERRLGPVDSLWQGVARTVEMTGFSLRMMGRMLIGEASLRNVSGPVTIADYAGQTARLGLEPYIGFLALISISIGVLNLLPIPMLDGGHLLFYLIEAIRGRAVSERAREAGQRIGIALLFGLMSLAFFNDLVRLFS